MTPRTRERRLRRSVFFVPAGDRPCRPVCTRIRVFVATLLGVATSLAPLSVRAADTGWVIECHSPESQPATFAAEELKRYLGHTYDGAVDVGVAKPNDARVVIGLRKDLPDDLAAHLPDAQEGHDGYAVAIRRSQSGKPLWIVGGDDDRGVLYGAYDVLERLGWRWFHPTLDPKDPHVEPEAKNPTLPEDRWSFASPMRSRALIWYVSRTQMEKTPPSPTELRTQIDWAMKSRYNALEHRALEGAPSEPLRTVLETEAARRGMMLQSPGHNFDLFFPDDPKTFDAHPDWFGQRDGERRRHNHSGAQFCWTNEEATARFIENATEFVKSRPALRTLTVSALDGGPVKPCECEVCAKQPATDRYLALLNRLTKHLAKEAPGVTVEAIVGYQHVAELPESVTPHERLRGRFAPWKRNVGRGYSEDMQGVRLAHWSDLFDARMTAFQYYSDHFAAPALAPPYTVGMKSDRDYIVAIGADGMLNLLYLEGYWWRQTLNANLAGRGFYDPSSDLDGLLRDYARRYHGPDAGPFMAEYYARLSSVPKIGNKAWRLPERKHQRFLSQLRERQLRPAAKTVGDDAVFRYRLEKAKDWHAVIESAAAAGMWLRHARTRFQSGRPGGDEMLRKANEHYEQTQALAAKVAASHRGILSPAFKPAYRLHFKAVSDRAKSSSETSTAQEATGAGSDDAAGTATKAGD